MDSNEKTSSDVPAQETTSFDDSTTTNTTTSSFSTVAEEFQRSVIQSKDSAIRSARSLHERSSYHLHSFQDFLPQLKSQYRAYEDTVFTRVKDELMTAKQHPAAALGLGVAAAFILMRGPRRFLVRNTLGRFQSEEAQFVRAENSVKELNLSVGLLKKESGKLLERAAFAEKEMKQGHNELKNAGSSIQRLAKSMYKVETQAADLMDGLREISGREPLRLRAEVASMASALKRHRVLLDKRIMKISELGVSV